MRRLALVACLLLASPAIAQQVDASHMVEADWMALMAAQEHLRQSTQAMMKDLADARAKVAELQAEIAKLKAAPPAAE